MRRPRAARRSLSVMLAVSTAAVCAALGAPLTMSQATAEEHHPVLRSSIAGIDRSIIDGVIIEDSLADMEADRLPMAGSAVPAMAEYRQGAFPIAQVAAQAPTVASPGGTRPIALVPSPDAALAAQGGGRPSANPPQSAQHRTGTDQASRRQSAQASGGTSSLPAAVLDGEDPMTGVVAPVPLRERQPPQSASVGRPNLPGTTYLDTVPKPVNAPSGDRAAPRPIVPPPAQASGRHSSDGHSGPSAHNPAVSPQASPGTTAHAPAGPSATAGTEQPAAAAPPMPATPLDAALIQRLASGEAFAGSRLTKAEREALKTYYASRGHVLWIDNGTWTPAAKAVQAQIERAYEDGLDPNDYPRPRISVLPANQPELALADADVALSAAAVAYARDASGGRLDLAKLSKHITPKLDLPEPAAVLDTVSTASDAGQALANYNPQHPGYQALKRKLAEVQAMRPPQPRTPQVKVPPGRTLKVGMRDPRVPLVRVRFGLSPSEEQLYDEEVATAVANFQRQQGLHSNGVLNKQTQLAMAGGGKLPLARNTGDIIVNMERWRWLPRDLGQNYIFVSIPEYTVRLIKQGEMVHEARTIVGKAETPTPIFSDSMQYAVVNPYWNVPPSIMKNEFLPGLARDPNYAAKRGYQVVKRGNTISVRQPPGERNALGHIKFMFPNDHAVYLHDTPSRSLFANANRAYSHGCVRVDKPMRFAELILGMPWSEPRIKALIGKGGERTIRLAQPLPIHLTYFTLAVDEDNKLLTRSDIYGLDRAMREALDLS